MSPLILVTNDDGYFSPGIHALIEAVKPLGEVVVVAPDKGQSAKSHAITIDQPLFVREKKSEQDVKIYACSGTPVDCVKFALNSLLDRQPNYIVSGINHGSNASINILYSGTMAAVMEGAMSQITSIGFSLANYQIDADLSLATNHAHKIVTQVMLHKLPNNICLNVNIPAIPINESKGIKICRQAKARWREKFEPRTHPHGYNYFWLTGKFENFEPQSTDTDEWALANGYTSIVPITIDYTHFESIEMLKEWKI